VGVVSRLTKFPHVRKLRPAFRPRQIGHPLQRSAIGGCFGGKPQWDNSRPSSTRWSVQSTAVDRSTAGSADSWQSIASRIYPANTVEVAQLLVTAVERSTACQARTLCRYL
jgi:hypothetical protein